MDVSVKLKEQPIHKLFISYLIPSILGMAFMALNVLVDGIMVSRGVGEYGLAGVNIAMPAFSIFFSISLWIGTGGGALYSILIGENKRSEARSIFMQSMTLATVVIGTLSMLCLWQVEKLSYLFGANEVILPYVVDYLEVILAFGVIYGLENVLSIFIRNDGNPKLSMASLIVTALLNILFNYLFIFVFQWGMKGSAYATILSAAIGFLVLLSHFFRKGRTLSLGKVSFRWPDILQIIKIGTPSFVTEASFAIVTIGFNVAFIRHVGENGVAAYAIVNTIHSLMLLVFWGIGAALQPMASFYYGARLFERLQAGLKLAIGTALGLGIIGLGVGFFLSGYLVRLFAVDSEELLQLTMMGISLFFVHYLFLGYNLVYAEYFQSICLIRRSILIILLRGIFLIFPLLWIMPAIWGPAGIWLVLAVAEGITAVIVFALNKWKPVLPVRQAGKSDDSVSLSR